MLARRWLAGAELVGDADAAHAVLDEIAVDLRREMPRRIAQPVHDLEAPLVGQRLDDVRWQAVAHTSLICHLANRCVNMMRMTVMTASIARADIERVHAVIAPYIRRTPIV